MSIQLEKVVLELTTKVDGVNQGLDQVIARMGKAKRAAKDTSGDVLGLEKSWAKLAGAFTAGALMDRAVMGIVSMGKSAIDSAGQIVDLADATGLSTDAVQLYGAVAKQTGGDLNTYADAIFKLGVNLSKGGAEVEGTIKRLGLNYAQLRAMKPEEQFEAVAAKLKNVSNEGDRNRMGVELYGKTWSNVAAGVVAGIDEIRDATIIAGEAQVRAVDAASAAWDQFIINAQAKTTNFLGNAVIGFLALRGTIDGSTLLDFAGLSPTARALIDQILGTGSPRAPGGPGRSGAGDAEARAQGKSRANEAERLAKALKDTEDQLTGKKLVEEMHRWDDAVVLAGLHSRITATEMVKLVERLKVFRAAGITLDPVLHDLLIEQEAVNSEFERWNEDLAFMAAQHMKAIREQTIPTAEGILGLGESWRELNDTINKTPKDVPDYLEFDPRFQSSSNPEPGPDAPEKAGRDLSRYVTLMGIAAELTNTFGHRSSRAWDAVNRGISIAIAGVEDYAAASRIADKQAREAAQAAAVSHAAQAGLYAGFAYLASKIAEAYAEDAAWAEHIREVNAELRALWFTEAAVLAMREELGRASIERILELWQANSDEITTVMSRMGAAVELFGGRAPAALQPLLAELLESVRLTDAQREGLEALQGPVPWQAAEEAAGRYGLSIDHLGEQFNQLRSNDMFDRLFSDWTTFSDIGADSAEVFKAMSGQVSEALIRARKFGLAVPEYMRPLLEGMLQAGQLIDENGNALTDLGGIEFSASIESSLARLGDILTEIRDLLAFDITAAAGRNATGRATPRSGRTRADETIEYLQSVPGAIDDGRARILPMDYGSSMRGQSGPVVTQYTGNVEINIAGKRVGDVLIEDILRTFEQNAGDGRPVGPTSRLNVALRKAA